MAWKATFTRDTEKAGVGTAVAEYWDTSTPPVMVVRLEARVDEAKDVAAFVSKAKAMLANEQTKRAAMASIAAKIEGALNA